MKKRYTVDEYITGTFGYIEKRFDVYDSDKIPKDGCETVLCTCYTRASAKKIAKALNAMEIK